MAELLIFHHAQGLTPGVLAFAERVRAAGHTARVPDLFNGRTFDSLQDGIAYAGEVGFGAIVERGRAVADGLPEELVCVGFSLGALPAQALAQTRAGGPCRGAVPLLRSPGGIRRLARRRAAADSHHGPRPARIAA
jgi:dienelactone hydrolase